MYLVKPQIVLSMVLIGALGAGHGIFADRWASSEQLQEAIKALPKVPKEFGLWEGGDDLSPDTGDLQRIGIKACLLRQFRHRDSRETVSLLLVCGRGGPISVHTPDICYVNAGYKELGIEKQREIVSSDGRRASFNVGRFGKPDGVVATQLEIFWAWSRDGVEWQAPENPRMSLARLPVLYKMYIVREFVPGTCSETADTPRSFLLRALPDIRRSLAPGGW